MDSDLILKLSETHEGKDKEEILKVFDQEVESFSSYLGSLPEGHLGKGVLSTAEKALLKSYLVAKYRGRV